jgi:hypothetical protein
MKITSTIALTLAACCLLMTSCNKKADAALTASGKGFELSDVTDQSVKQAASETVRVAIDRKGGFDGEVTIEVMGVPAGVTVEGGNTHKILARDSAVSLKLLAADTATPSDKNEIRVKASATADGTPLSKTDNFNLTVRAK